DLIRHRRPIPRRPALDDVANVNVLTLHLASADDPIQELPGRTHKGLPLSIFIGSRRLADKAKLGVQPAYAEDGLLPASDKRSTARARANGPFQSLQFGYVRHRGRFK